MCNKALNPANTVFFRHADDKQVKKVNRTNSASKHQEGPTISCSPKSRMLELEIPLGISVNTWNIVKFIGLEVLVSIVFAALWTDFVGQWGAHILQKGDNAVVRVTNLGRFTPAEVICQIARSKNGKRIILRRGYVLLFLINVVLISIRLLLEYGSSETVSRRTQNALHVSKNSITKHNQLLAAGNFLLTASLRKGFSKSTAKALKPSTNRDTGLPAYEMHEHAIDTPLKPAEKRLAARFEKICGDSSLSKHPECLSVLEPVIGNSSEQNHVFFAQVTKVYSSGNLFDVRLDSLGLHGTCHGKKLDVTGFNALLNHSSVNTISCVFLSTATNRVYVVFPEPATSAKLNEYKESISIRKRPETPNGTWWLDQNSTILLETKNTSALSFISSVPVNPSTAALHLWPQESAYRKLNSFDMDLTVFAEYRRHVMLLCLALSGEYYANRSVTFELSERQAAVNIFFVFGIGALVLLSFLLASISCHLRRKNYEPLPVSIEALFDMMQSKACSQCSECEKKGVSFVNFRAVESSDNLSVCIVCRKCCQ